MSINPFQGLVDGINTSGNLVLSIDSGSEGITKSPFMPQPMTMAATRRRRLPKMGVFMGKL